MKNSITLSSFRTSLLVLALFAGSIAVPAIAADKYSEEHIMREISYLAKKLLDMSGEDAVRVESPAYIKPFIGICTEIESRGMRLTCVTPGTQAAKAGLQTGDLILKISDQKFVEGDEAKIKRAYYGVVETMATGDIINMTMERGAQRKEVVVTVGSLNHPGYVLEVKR